VAKRIKVCFSDKAFRSRMIQSPPPWLSISFCRLPRKLQEIHHILKILITVKTIIMKVTSILSICTLALASAVSANHSQFEHASVGPTYSEAPATRPTHMVHSAPDASRYEYTHEATVETTKPTAAHHWTREATKPTSHLTHFDFDEMDDEDDDEGEKPPVTRHWARMFKSTTKHTAAPASVSKPTPVAAAGGNPYAGTRFTPASAMNSVHSILTGGTGIAKTCDRCEAAMQVGQALAQQSSANDFSSAVIGLCKQVRYKSDSACDSSFSPAKVAPYMQTLQSAEIATDGKSFSRSYFNTC
jgi:ribosomal protein L18